MNGNSTPDLSEYIQSNTVSLSKSYASKGTAIFQAIKSSISFANYTFDTLTEQFREYFGLNNHRQLKASDQQPLHTVECCFWACGGLKEVGGGKGCVLGLGLLDLHWIPEH